MAAGRTSTGAGAALLALAVALAIASPWLRPAPPWEFAFQEPPAGAPAAAPAAAPPEFRTVLDIRGADQPGGGATLHSPAILRARPPAILWFQGSREAAHDVRIMSVTLEGDSLAPGAPEPLLAAASMSRAMRPPQVVMILGNTIQARPGARDRLLATVVSAGGWAASSIASVEMGDGQPVRARKLALSPLLNRSQLVRNAVIRFANGDIGVPAYFEMAAAFPELVRLDADMRVRAKVRMGQGVAAIQPAIVVTGPKTAVALMRPFGKLRRVFRSETRDGGKTWTTPAPLMDLPNPGAPVAALGLARGRILMAFNDGEAQADNLTLAVSDDAGRNWKRLVQIETPGRETPAVYRYPDLARLDDGRFLLTYSTFAKGGIRAHVFNRAWLDSQEADDE